jgi:hypothetical protein
MPKDPTLNHPSIINEINIFNGKKTFMYIGTSAGDGVK